MFYSASGTTLLDPDGDPFCFVGANVYDFHTYTPDTAITPLNNQAAADRIDNHMQTLKDNCMKVVRLWMFSEGTGWHDFEPSKGVYDNDQFTTFDYIIDSAERHDMALIPVLLNWFDAYGGVRQRLLWEGASVNSFGDRVQFFDQSTPQGAAAYQGWLDYISYALNRTNVFTGRQYKDEPAIFSWELCNEPRVYPNNGPEPIPGTILRNWVDQTGSFIKNIDSNHMLGTGQEGQGQPYGYSGNGSENGAPFVFVQQSPFIDWASSHYYPFIVNHTLTNQEITTCAWADAAENQIGKPLIIGEYGVRDGDNPSLWYSEMCGLTCQCKVDGIIWWWFPDGNWSWHTANGEPFLQVGDAELGPICDCFCAVPTAGAQSLLDAACATCGTTTLTEVQLLSSGCLRCFKVSSTGTVSAVVSNNTLIISNNGGTGSLVIDDRCA